MSLPASTLSSSSPATARIRKVSASMVYVCLVLACAIPLVPLLAAVLFTTGFIPKLDATAQQPLARWALVTLGVFKVLPSVLLMVGLWRARACFKQFARGEFFTTVAVRCLREFSVWIAGSAVIALSGELAFAVLRNTVQTHYVVLNFAYSGHWLTLSFAAMVWVMAGLIGQGRSLAEENASFV